MKVSGRTALVVLAVWLACWGPAASLAQDGDNPSAQTGLAGQTMRFGRLTTEDGLSEGRVWCITQHRRGFLWFATWDGLNRYDGYEFKIYKQEPGRTDGPGGTSFWVVHADQAGMIWAGSPTGHGLSLFDPATEQWTVYLPDENDPQTLGSNIVYAVFEDSSGVLWAGTDGGGLNRLEEVTEDGMARFTRYQHDANDENSLGSDFVPSIHEDRSGVLWIGAYVGGLHRFDRETRTFARYQHDPQDPHSLSDNRVFSIYEDQFGVLRVGTYGGGLNRLDRETGAFERYQPDPEDLHSLSGNAITAILGIEHHWATHLREAIAEAGGVALAQAMISPQVLVMVGAELNAMLEAEAAIEAAEAIKYAAALEVAQVLAATALIEEAAIAEAADAVAFALAVEDAAAEDVAETLLAAELIEEAALDDAAAVVAGALEVEEEAEAEAEEAIEAAAALDAIRALMAAELIEEEAAREAVSALVTAAIIEEDASDEALAVLLAEDDD